MDNGQVVERAILAESRHAREMLTNIGIRHPQAMQQQLGHSRASILCEALCPAISLVEPRH
jgi:hypothetical protein